MRGPFPSACAWMVRRREVVLWSVRLLCLRSSAS